MIISELSRPVPVVTSFTLEMMTLSSNEAPLTIGQVLIIHSKLDKSNGKITKIHLISQGDKSKKNSPIIPKNHFATVDITLEKPICLEINSNFNALSRITLRDEGKTVACGVVKKLLK
jgi:elongation factor 1 alpha-like protein